MLKAAIEKILSLDAPHIEEIEGRTYVDKDMTQIGKELRATSITMSNLTATTLTHGPQLPIQQEPLAEMLRTQFLQRTFETLLETYGSGLMSSFTTLPDQHGTGMTL